jgi:hypothetical protein
LALLEKKQNNKTLVKRRDEELKEKDEFILTLNKEIKEGMDDFLKYREEIKEVERRIEPLEIERNRLLLSLKETEQKKNERQALVN